MNVADHNSRVATQTLATSGARGDFDVTKTVPEECGKEERRATVQQLDNQINPHPVPVPPAPARGLFLPLSPPEAACLLALHSNYKKMQT